LKKNSPSLKCSVESEDSGSGLRIVMHLNKTKGQMGRVYSKEGIAPTIDSISYGANHPKILDVPGPTTTTNMPVKSTEKDSERKNSSKATSEISEQAKYLNMTYLLQDFPVNLFPLPENARVFKTKQGELFSMRYAELLEIKDLDSYSLRMLKDYFLTTRAEPSQLYSFHWMSLGMMSNGRCLTLSIGCPKTGKGSLSSVLEEKVDEKYYLSKGMREYLMRNSDGRKTAQERDEAYALSDADYKGPSMQRQNVVMIHNAFPDKERIYKKFSPTISTPSGGGHLPYIANTVDVDGYLRRGTRDRDKNGRAILTSIPKRRIRRLTPKECERLQGFPDDWTEGISDTQRYKAMGNAVSVPVITAIGKKILKTIK